MPVTHVGLSPVCGPPSPPGTTPGMGTPPRSQGWALSVPKDPRARARGWWEVSREPLWLRTAGPRVMITLERDFLRRRRTQPDPAVPSLPAWPSSLCLDLASALLPWVLTPWRGGCCRGSPVIPPLMGAGRDVPERPSVEQAGRGRGGSGGVCCGMKAPASSGHPESPPTGSGLGGSAFQPTFLHS